MHVGGQRGRERGKENKREGDGEGRSWIKRGRKEPRK